MCSERPIEVIIIIVIGVENKNIERRLCCWAAQHSNSFSARENNNNTPGYRHKNESPANLELKPTGASHGINTWQL